MAQMHKGRRRFLGFLSTSLFTVIGLCLALPGLAYFGAPMRRKSATGEFRSDFVDAGPLVDLPVGQWQLRTVELAGQDGWEKTILRYAVWIHRESESADAITVLSSICPHLGCPVQWQAARAQFVCPCHHGTFDARGRTLAGPPPRGMDPLPFEIRSGRLWVLWNEFKTGSAERIPVCI